MKSRISRSDNRKEFLEVIIGKDGIKMEEEKVKIVLD